MEKKRYAYHIIGFNDDSGGGGGDDVGGGVSH